MDLTANIILLYGNIAVNNSIMKDIINNNKIIIVYNINIYLTDNNYFDKNITVNYHFVWQ